MFRRPAWTHSSDIFLTIFAVASVVFSLAVRAIYRGLYCAGWELLGQAQGQFLLATQPFLRACARVLWDSRHYPTGYFTTVNSIPFTFIPGFLGLLQPWQFWGHALTFVLFLVTLWLIADITRLSPRRFGVLLLMWGASPALLSYAVTGYPYITAFLPHALALRVVLNAAQGKRWSAAAVECVVICELSWHLYPLGKTVYLVFLTAAWLARRAPREVRAIWLIAGVLQAIQCLCYRDYTVDALVHVNPLRHSFTDIGGVLRHLANAYILAPSLDLPVLFSLGILSFAFYRKNRTLIGVLFLCQSAAVFILALMGLDSLRTYRVLIIYQYLMLSLAQMLSEWEGRKEREVWRRGLIAALLLGNAWQIADLLIFVRQPIASRTHALPFAFSKADYFIKFEAVRAVDGMRRRVDAGEKLLLIYNVAAYPENRTDPAALLERLYLSLGHRRFTESVFAFGAQSCRYACLPIHAPGELDSFLNGADLSKLTGFYYDKVDDRAPEFPVEAAAMMSRIGLDYSVDFEPDDGAMFRAFRLRRKAPAGASNRRGRAPVPNRSARR